MSVRSQSALKPCLIMNLAKKIITDEMKIFGIILDLVFCLYSNILLKKSYVAFSTFVAIFYKSKTSINVPKRSKAWSSIEKSFNKIENI